MKPITIQSIWGGQSPAKYFAGDGQFDSSIGIDPDFPADDSGLKASGYIRPTAMAKFSGANIDSTVNWLLTNPKTAVIHAYQAGGKFVSYTEGFASETLIGTPTSGAGNGAAYYDNYIYLATPTDVARYGPLNGSPTLANGYWGTTLGKTALTNTTYPTVIRTALPNHVMHKHTDNKLYIADVVGNQGVLHFIKTSKATVEGDTNDGSTFNAIDFPLGMWPTAIESYGTDLAVALIQKPTSGSSLKNAVLSFWDTTSVSYSKIIDVEFPDTYITALRNINGILYVFSSNGRGVRLSHFVGGYTLQEDFYLEDSYPPYAGAVDHILNKIIWGGFTSYPETSACVYAWGSKSAKLGKGLQTILKTTSAGANPYVGAVKHIKTATTWSKPQVIAGWIDDSAQGIDSLSTTYGVSVWRSEVFRIGKPFKINKIRIPLAQAVAANMTITPKVFVDEFSSSETLRVINNTNFPTSERNATLYPAIEGKHNFSLELRWTGTALLTVALPIEIEFEFIAD